MKIYMTPCFIYSFIHSSICWLFKVSLVSSKKVSACISAFDVRIPDMANWFVIKHSELLKIRVNRLRSLLAPFWKEYDPEIPPTPGGRIQWCECMHFWHDWNANGAICLSKLIDWIIVTWMNQLAKTRNTNCFECTIWGNNFCACCPYIVAFRASLELI